MTSDSNAVFTAMQLKASKLTNMFFNPSGRPAMTKDAVQQILEIELEQLSADVRAQAFEEAADILESAVFKDRVPHMLRAKAKEGLGG